MKNKQGKQTTQKETTERQTKKRINEQRREEKGRKRMLGRKEGMKGKETNKKQPILANKQRKKKED